MGFYQKELPKIKSQKGEFFDNVFDPLMKVGLLLMENVPTPSAKSVLVPLRLSRGVIRAAEGIIRVGQDF